MTSGDPLARLRAQLEETFHEELSERLHEMEAAALELERANEPAQRDAAVRRLSRDAHSLKGGAQLLGYEAVARIAHALEEALGGSGLPPQQRSDAAPSAEVLLATLDALRGAAVEPAAVDVTAAIERLLGPDHGGAQPPPISPAPRSSRSGRRAQPRRPPSLPSPSEPPTSEADDAISDEPISAEDARLSRQRTVRVATERVDQLLVGAGELIVARNRLRRRWLDVCSAASAMIDAPDGWAPETQDERAALLARAIADADQYHFDLGLLLERLEHDLLGLRIVPMEQLFRPFARMVRDIARSTGKQVEFEGVGWETPLDRELLEQLREPVMHLLRNAVDHGIEPPAERIAAGKPPVGRVALRAGPRAGGVVIEVWDDGRGLDPAAIGAAAQRVGLVTPDDAPLDVIFQPGFSTAPGLTDLSGRGLGLDVVRTTVTAVGGTVEVGSHVGRETSFILRVPLTLVQARMLLVTAGGRPYALPVAGVRRVTAAASGKMRRLGQRLTITVDGEQVVVANLSDLLGTQSESDATAGRFIVVLESITGRTGIIVDSVEGEREIVVRGLGSVLSGHPVLAGAAVVDDQTVVPVLDHAALVRRALDASAAATHEGPARRPTRVLVVEDSLATRTLERHVLAAAGFEVEVAVDGRDALRQLRAQPPDVVVSDVDMPRMDGFELLRTIRADAQLKSLPVILVTSLEKPEQRELGFELGADAYLPKSTFDEQTLVEQIKELVS